MKCQAEIAGDLLYRYLYTIDSDKYKLHARDQLVSLQKLFNIVGYGSHEYIPIDQINQILKLPEGAGVYHYWIFADYSVLLSTYNHGLAFYRDDFKDVKMIDDIVLQNSAI